MSVGAAVVVAPDAVVVVDGVDGVVDILVGYIRLYADPKCSAHL